MPRLWLFNPWNDLALGVDSTFYTPPPIAIETAMEGETLPLWIAEPDDYVMLGSQGVERYNQLSHRYSLAKPWKGEPVDGCVPWGWSKAARQVFIKSGIDRDILPSDTTLDRLRALSHRRLTIDAHKYLDTDLIPIETADIKECETALDKWKEVVGKYPWSSTGRGLFSGNNNHRDSFLRRCAGAINHQGSVMIEKSLDVVCDFAMLFYISDTGSCRFRGFSLFKNCRRAYVHNLLMNDDEIASYLSRYIDPEILTETARSLEGFFEHFTGDVHRGWLGVDMLIFRNGNGTYSLNPCVEINLRHTMGVVAHELMSRHLPPGTHGTLSLGTLNIDNSINF